VYYLSPVRDAFSGCGGADVLRMCKGSRIGPVRCRCSGYVAGQSGVKVLACYEMLHRYKSKAVPLPSCRLQGGEEYSAYSFLTSALDEGEWSASRPDITPPPPERTPGAHWIGGWLGLRAGLDTDARGEIFASASDGNPVVHSVIRH
jgi:hypothetical protein